MSKCSDVSWMFLYNLMGNCVSPVILQHSYANQSINDHDLLIISGQFFSFASKLDHSFPYNEHTIIQFPWIYCFNLGLIWPSSAKTCITFLGKMSPFRLFSITMTAMSFYRFGHWAVPLLFLHLILGLHFSSSLVPSFLLHQIPGQQHSCYVTTTLM
jgi:hypothetical protein